MKTAAHTGWWWLAAVWLVASVAGAQAQEAPLDAAWKASLASLQEEHDSQTGVAVSIVFDDSGSMNDHGKLRMAKKAFQAWIEHARDDYRFGLITLNAGLLVPLQRHDRAQVLAAVQALRASGNTPLADTIARAGADIRQRRAAGAVYERQVVVILTDGEDTTDRGIEGVQEEILRLRREGVEVIAFGYQGEGDYMRQYATHFFSPENEQDISRGLNGIDSEVRDTSDVIVDNATRQIMQNLPVATSLQSVPIGSAAGSSPTASPSPTPARRHHTSSLHWKWLVVIAVVALALSRRNRR